MRHLIPILLLITTLGFAGSPGEATETPNVVAKMVQALADSGIVELTSRTCGGGKYSYHLKTIDYLGTLNRDGRRYTIAAARFLRSSARGSEYPPAKGHGFLIVFDDAFKVATHGRLPFGDYYMEGSVLKSGEAKILDFGTTEAAIRYHGWLVDSAFMTYPFADRISETEWKSGAFRKKP